MNNPCIKYERLVIYTILTVSGLIFCAGLPIQNALQPAQELPDESREAGEEALRVRVADPELAQVKAVFAHLLVDLLRLLRQILRIEVEACQLVHQVADHLPVLVRQGDLQLQRDLVDRLLDVLPAF